MLDDSLDKVKKMINNLNNFREQMTMISETNEALIARNTNDTIKILTAVSLIAVIPTAITSFFGMNVYFGWTTIDSYFPVALISFVVVSATVITLFYFKKKRWL